MATNMLLKLASFAHHISITLFHFRILHNGGSSFVAMTQRLCSVLGSAMNNTMRRSDIICEQCSLAARSDMRYVEALEE